MSNIILITFMDPALEKLYYPLQSKWDRVFDRQFNQQLAQIWTVKMMETNLEVDQQRWAKLSDNKRQCVRTLTCYFSLIDYFAHELAMKMTKIQNINIYAAYMFNSAATMEVIHEQMYSKFLNMIWNDHNRIEEIRAELSQCEPAQDMLQWASTYAQNNGNDKRLIVLGALMFEALLIKPFFIVPIAIKKTANELPGFVQGNEYVARDESLHIANYIHFYRYLCDTLHGGEHVPEERIKSMVAGAVNMSLEMFALMLPSDIVEWRLFLSDIRSMVYHNANELLKYLGCTAHYQNVPKSDAWNLISDANNVNTFGSFHEDQPTEYTLPSSSQINWSFMD